MPSYILRDIPPELWKQVKSRAALDGKPLRSLFLGWLEQYSSGQPVALKGSPLPADREWIKKAFTDPLTDRREE